MTTIELFGTLAPSPVARVMDPAATAAAVPIARTPPVGPRTGRPPLAAAAALGSAVRPSRTPSVGAKATICSRSPSVLVSAAVSATLYQPFPISLTAPAAAAKAPPALERLTVTVFPVAGET